MEQKIWWYTLNNEQKGPITEEELNLLASQNFINQGTLVWKEGMPNWISLADVNAPVDTLTHKPPQPPGFSQTRGSQPQSGNGNPQQNAGYPQQNTVYPQQSPTVAQPNMSQPGFNSQAGTTSVNPLNFITDYYYRSQFELIINSKETYKGKWNWWAFFFSWVWCFTKGLWQYGAIVMAVSIGLRYYLPYEVTGAFALVVAIFFGSRGTWLYYNLKIKNKQLA